MTATNARGNPAASAAPPGADCEPERAEDGPRDLYRTDDLLVRFVRPPGASSELLFVTFDSFSNNRSLDRAGFGEAFFVSRGIAAIHVISRDNLWYQEEDLPLALAAARAVADGFGRVLAYGSSMGGYGAIRFGGAAGATVAVAISPQYSIDPAKVPFENRWANHSASIRFVNEARPFSPVRQAFVFYDPRDRDRRHVDLLAAEHPVVRLRMPYAGHPAGAYLAETGLLQSALAEIGAGTFDPRGFEARARVARRRSGQYLFTLARLQPLRRMNLKLSLAHLAVAASPGDPEYRGYLGFALDHVGSTSAAGAAYREALSHGPDQPLALERYGRHLMRHGAMAEARAVLSRAAIIGGPLQRVQRSFGLVLLACGEWRQAARSLARLAWTQPQVRRVLAREIVLVLAWIAGGRRRSVEPVDPRPVLPLDTERDLLLRKITRRRWWSLLPGRSV